MKIPISVKLIIMTSVLLLGATIPIAREASRYFETVFRQREETFNFDIVGARAGELEMVLNDLVDKSRLVGAGLPDGTPGIWTHNKNIFGIELRDANDKVLSRKWNDVRLKDVCQCDPTLVTQSLELQTMVFELTDEHPVGVVNATVKKGPPLLAIALPFQKDQNGNVQKKLIAYFDLGAIQKPFSEARERTFFGVDRNGHLLGSTNESKLETRQFVSDFESVRFAEKSRLPRGQRRVEDSVSGERVYSAFAKTSYGVTMFSEVPEDIILEPSIEVRRKVILIAGVTLSSAFFLVFLFSITLTGPIEKLAALARAYAKGKVTSLEGFRQTSRWVDDEVGTLTRTFERMLIGLRERDMMKSLFKKFHGSKIADKILKGKVSLSGVRNNAIVFFCDLRGFTTYAEKNSPEEVFAMLNEYFGIMVEIITEGGGLVDKFIGDAILAVWGAPVATDTDAKDAVWACLKMRLALDILNQKRILRQEDPLYMGMSLHSGPVISGTIGSNERMEFTVIGNTVNTASRIEGMTKSFGVDLLISETVKSLVTDQFEIEYVGESVLRGQKETARLYEVVGPKKLPGDMENQIVTPYSKFERSGVRESEFEPIRTLPADLIEPLKEAQDLMNEKHGKFNDLHLTMRRVIASYIDSYLRTYQMEIRAALPADVVAAVNARDQGKCQAHKENGEICGSNNMLHLHHLVRPSDGGTNVTENIITLCYDHQRVWVRRKRIRKAA